MKKKSRTIVVKYSLWSRTHYVSCLSHSYLSLVYSTNLPSNREIGENERKEIQQKRRKRGKLGKKEYVFTFPRIYSIFCVDNSQIFWWRHRYLKISMTETEISVMESEISVKESVSLTLFMSTDMPIFVLDLEQFLVLNL